MNTSFLKDLRFIFQSKAAIIIFGVAMSVVTARYLGPEGNGIIASIMVYPTLFMSIGSLGIRQSTTYFVGQEKHSISEIYSAALSIWLLTSLVSMLCCFVLIQYVTKTDFLLVQVLLVLSTIPFSLYNTYTSGIFLGKKNIKEFNRINWVPAFLNLLFTFLLVGPIPLGVTGSLIGSLLSVFFMAVVVFRKMRQQISFRINFNWPLLTGMLKLGLIYALSLFVINLNYKADVILLDQLSTKHELGIYSKGVSIVQYLWEIPMLLSTLIFSRSAASKNPELFSLQVCRLLRFAGVIILVASVVLFLLSGFVINLLFGPKFEASAMVLKLLMPGIFLLTIFKVLFMDMAGKGKPWISLTAMIPAVIINILLNIWWIPAYGANGSALASTVSYSVAALVFLFVYSKKVNIPIKTIFSFTREDVEFVQGIYRKLRNKTALT